MNAREALQRIRDAGECFVIFDGDTGEVLEVQTCDAASTPVALLTTMTSASNSEGSVKGRFFDGASVTLEDLEDEVNEARMVAGRVAIFSRRATTPPDELVHILDEFADPMDPFHGPKVIIERLFDHPPDALRPLIPRLDRVAQSFAERGIEHAVRRLLESKLAVMAGDFARLKAIWDLDPRTSPIVWHPTLLECIGDLRSCDPEPIEILIQTVSSPEPMMFESRCEAMRALGKVGAAVGARAAEGIRATIFDSGPWVVELRERVLSRIETPASAWQPCPHCYCGRVPGRPWQGDDQCASCLGLGVVRRPS